MGGHDRWRTGSIAGLRARAAMSPAVIVLLVLAALGVALGFGRLPDQLLDIGVLLVGVFLAVVARICQARDQHLVLSRLLGEGHRQRRY